MSTLISMVGRDSRSFSSKTAMAALLLMGFLLSAIHGHAASPDPGTVKIYSFSSASDGCTWDLQGEVSDDGKSLTVKFGQYNVSGIMRKFCTVTMSLGYPAGIRFRLVAVTMSGHAKLDDHVTASIHTRYHTSGHRFNGRPRSGTARCVITGPLDGSFNCMDDFDEPSKEPIYGHCNSRTELAIPTELRSNGQVHFDLTQVFAIAWESC